jgi:hypothetical protein
MTHFLAIFIGTQASMEKWHALTEQERKERELRGMAAWSAWVEQHKDVIVEMGAPLGKTKSVSATGITDIRNNMSAFTIVQAESHDAAAKLFEAHPHFMIFPGDAVEVMGCLPVPGQSI